MGIFYSAAVHPAVAIQQGISAAAAPGGAANAGVLIKQATDDIKSKLDVTRVAVAGAIALLLLAAAIWTKYLGYEDISKTLMTSFTGFSGIVLGALGGEASKAA
jgi:hypothetical protein